MTRISPQRLSNVQKKFIRVNGSRICYLEAGNPDAYPMIMIPGWMGSSIDLPTFFPFMSKCYHCFVLDMPGYGESDPLLGQHTIKAYANFLEAFAKKLKLDEFYLVGNCYGGSIALQYLLDYNRAKKIAVFTPVYWGKTLRWPIRLLSRLFYLPWTRWLYSYIIHHRWTMRIWVKVLIRHAGGDYKEDAITKKMNASTRAAMESMRELLKLDIRKRLPQINIPAAILLLPKDRVLRPRALADLKRYIPHARIIVAENKGHMADPDKMLGEYQRILKFFRSTESAVK